MMYMTMIYFLYSECLLFASCIIILFAAYLFSRHRVLVVFGSSFVGLRKRSVFFLNL